MNIIHSVRMIMEYVQLTCVQACARVSVPPYVTRLILRPYLLKPIRMIRPIPSNNRQQNVNNLELNRITRNYELTDTAVCLSLRLNMDCWLKCTAKPLSTRIRVGEDKAELTTTYTPSSLFYDPIPYTAIKAHMNASQND
jgi:hypothetical protein